MLKSIVRYIGLIIIILCGCFHIPEDNLVVSQRGDMNTIHTVGDCEARDLKKDPKSLAGAQSELNSNGFSLLNWNVIKGKKQDFENDFKRLSDAKDLIMVQEAYLTEEFQNLLEDRLPNWDLTTSFKYYRKETGVLTASRAAPNFFCMLRGEEPFIKFPKTILITRYALSQTNRMLLVVNVHLINFSPGTSSYRKQLQLMEQVVARHQGPLIVAGDFNSWSDERIAIVEALAKRLDLKAVQFQEDSRVRVLGEIVDQIYYRGLVLIEANTLAVSSSDHNPMAVAFALSSLE